MIPSKEEIKKLEERVRSKLNQPKDFEFTGRITIDVKPHLINDVSFKITTDKEPLEIDMLIYSARYPESYFTWENFVIPDIRNKIRYNRILKENESLKEQIKEID